MSTTVPQLDKHRVLGQLQPIPNTTSERYRAALYIASSAHNAGDCAQLLDMLGLLNPRES